MRKYSANFFTLVRVIAAFVMPYWFSCIETVDGQCWFIIGLTLVALTDYVDGKLARSRLGMRTLIGGLLDQTVDKLLVIAVFLPLIKIGMVSIPVLLVIVSRDLWINSLRTVVAKKGGQTDAMVIGKYKMIFQFVLAGILYARVGGYSGESSFLLRPLHMVIEIVQVLPEWAIYVAILAVVLLTVVSGWIYNNVYVKIIGGRKVLTEEVK